jgi:hypothetical protein
MVKVLMTKIKMKKVGLLILISSFLQGCILTDEFKESLVEENKKSQKTLIEKSKDMQQAQKLEQLEISVNELIEFKPQLVRVIRLEQDLAFLAQSMKTIRGTSRSSYLPSASDEGLQSSLESVVDKKKDQNPVLPDGNNLPAELRKIAGITLLEQPVVTTTSVELNSAPALIESRSVIPATNTSMDAKFSSLPSNNSGQSTKTNTIVVKPDPEMTPNKFSSNLSNAKAGWEEDCNVASSPSGVFSIHLASYSNLQNAKEGWEQLSKKYVATLCGLKPVLANVNVAGKEYLSLRVGPFASARDAGRLCDVIRSSGDYCAQARYEGRSL